MATSAPELALVVSDNVPAAGAVPSSPPLTSPATPAAPSQRAFSLGGGERAALPAATASLKRASVHKTVHDGATRVREPGLRDLADAYASAVPEDGSDGALAADTALQAGSELSHIAYVQLLRAAVFAWRGGCDSLLSRLEAAETLRALLEVPEPTHSRALQAAFARNSHALPELLSRRAALHHALRQPDDASHRRDVAGPNEFLDGGQRAQWLRDELAACGAAIDALQRRPAFSGVLHVDVQSIVALQAGRRTGRLSRLVKCCAAPQSTAGALFLKVWLHGNGDKAAQQGQYTQIGEPRGQGANPDAVDWRERLQPLLVFNRAALLCIELRRLKHGRRASDDLAGRGKGGAMDHTASSYVTLGAVAIPLARLASAGLRPHKCRAALIAAASSRGLHSDTSLDVVESTAVHGRGSQRGEAATGLQLEQRDSFKTFETVTDAIGKRRVVGTVKLGFALVVEEVRGATGTKGDPVDSGSEARISESLPSHGASAAASLQASERSLPGLDGCEAPAKTGHAGNPPEPASPAIAAAPPEVCKEPRLRSVDNRAGGRDRLQRSNLQRLRSLSLRRRTADGQTTGHVDPEAMVVALLVAFWRLAAATQREGRVLEFPALPNACLPPDPPAGATPPPLHACTALLSACNAPFPPQTLLTLVSLVATLQHVRPATVLTHLLSLATHHLHAAAAPAVAADTFPAALLAFERLMTPLATCARRRALTRREFTLYSRATSPLLSECARTFELLHWLRTSSAALSRQPDCVLRLVGLVGLATRFDADPGGVWDLVRPHFAAAVRRGMLEHAAALEAVRSPYAAIDSLIWALAALLEDTQAEAAMARSLPEPYVAMAAHARYRVVAAGVERAWGGAVAEGAPVLMYDERLQQLEGFFRDVHELFVRLDLSQQHSRRSITQSAQPGRVLYLPGSGIALLDIDALLAPQVVAWIDAFGANLERGAERAFDADNSPPHGADGAAWRVLSSERRHSRSVVEIFQVLSHNLPHLLERAVATRPPRLAAANAEAVIAAVGGMLRRYCGLLEESALADLVPGAEAGRAAGTLAADAAALLLGCTRGGLARANMPAQSDADHVTMGCLAPVAQANGDTDLAACGDDDAPPAIITPHFATKLNNAAEALAQYGTFEASLAAAVEGCMLRTDPAHRESALGRAQDADSEPLSDADVSFMSVDLEAAASGSVAASRSAAALPPHLRCASLVAQHDARQCRQHLLAALHAVFGASLLRCLGAVLTQSVTPAGRGREPVGKRARVAGWATGWFRSPEDAPGVGASWDRSSAGTIGHHGNVLLSGIDAATTRRLEAMMDFVDRELQAAREHMSDSTHELALWALWDATLAAARALLLAAASAHAPLSQPQTRLLFTVSTVLHDRFALEHAAHCHGAAVPSTLDTSSALTSLLCKLALAPTERLQAEYNILRPAATGGERGAEARAGARAAAEPAEGGLTLMHVLQLLRQRTRDRAAQALLRDAERELVSHAPQVLFGLPASEATLCVAPCSLDPHGVSGTAYLTTDHVAFSSAAVAGGAAPAVTLCHRLSRVSAAAQTYVGRSRGLALTLADKTHFTLHKFEGAQRDALLDALRAHVAGTESTLDRQLRGVTAAVAAAALRLPPGERIARSYACVLHRAVRSRRGVLYVLRRELVFVAGARREHTALLAIDRVELARGRWTGQPSVHIACDSPPRRFEFCELTLSQCEELVATVLNAMAELA